MKNIKTFEQYTNEEINWKKLATGAALGAGLAFGSPKAVGQEVEPIAGKHGVDIMEDEVGVLVNDKEIIRNFQDLLKDPRIGGQFTLVKVHELTDEFSGTFVLYLRKPNMRPGEEEFKAYINYEDYNDFVDNGRISKMVLYQFKDVRPVPTEGGIKKHGL
jgi:hypothetical protein